MRIILLIPLLLLVGCTAVAEKEIRTEIEQAKYCSSDSDCVVIDGECPFGCYVSVNEAEAEKISRLISSHESSCVYGCIQCDKIPRCIEGSCRYQCSPGAEIY